MRDGKSFMNRDSSIDFFTDFPPILLTICYHIPTFFLSDIPKFSLNFFSRISHISQPIRKFISFTFNEAFFESLMLNFHPTQQTYPTYKNQRCYLDLWCRYSSYYDKFIHQFDQHRFFIYICEPISCPANPDFVKLLWFFKRSHSLLHVFLLHFSLSIIKLYTIYESAVLPPSLMPYSHILLL